MNRRSCEEGTGQTAVGRRTREDHPFAGEGDPWLLAIDTGQIIRNIVAGRANGYNSGDIERAFHRTFAHIMKALAVRLREETGLNAICLCGRTFRNTLLLSRAEASKRSPCARSAQ